MDPGTAIAVGDISAKALSVIWKYYSDVKDAKGDIEHLVEEIQGLQKVLESVRKLLEDRSIAERIPTSVPLLKGTKSFQSDMEALTTRLDPNKGTRAMRRVGIRALKWPLKKKEVNEFVTKLQRYKETLNLAFILDQTKVVHSIEDEQQLAKLPLAGDANYNAYYRQHQGTCTADTRVDLLQQLQSWATSHQKPIFWLSGMAGTGKSTIARTFAGSLDAHNILGGSFFFSRGSGDLNNAAKFVSTLAHQLASRSPELKSNCCKAIAEHSDVLRRGLRDQWKELIMEPLSITRFKERPTLSLVIDALDECDSDDDIRLLLQLFVEVRELDTVNLGIIVTSRPEIGIRLRFEQIPEIVHFRLDLRDIPRPIVEHDIRQFLEQELGRIREERSLCDWPREKDLESLVQRSDCLFIYAATVCRFVGDYDWSPEERLLEILQSDSVLGGDTSQLDEMYTQVLRRSLLKKARKADTTKLVDRFRSVVGVIVTSFDTLSIVSLASLLSATANSIETALGSLHSVLDIPIDTSSPIRLVHPSFRDFLVDEARCGDERFFIDQNLLHGKIVTSCLEALSSLTRNMGGLKSPDSSPQEAQRDILDERLPKYMQYSCQYWAKHLEKVNPDQRAEFGLYDDGKIHVFFQKHVLFWLEAMSLLGKMSEAVLVLYNLSNMFERHQHPALSADIEDAWRFALKNRSIIEQAPLQTYSSALVFSPKNCAIRKRSNLPSWMVEWPDVQEDWGPLLQTLVCESGYSIKSIALSFDGKFLACTYGKSIRLWDLATGAIHSTLEDPEGWTTELQFSRNGQLASTASTSYGNCTGSYTIRLWDPITGVAHGRLTLERSSERRKPVLTAFAPEGYLAIFSKENCLRLWDWKAGKTSDPPQFHFDVHAMAFLSDGRLIALHDVPRKSGTEAQSEVILYDPAVGTAQSVVFAPVCDMALSKQNRLALGLEDGSILIHDLMTKSQKKLEHHRTRIESLDFSPDGRYLASVSSDEALHLYKFVTHEDHSIAGKHRMVSFSHDGSLLASATWDTVQVWNPRIEVQTAPSNMGLDAQLAIQTMKITGEGRHLACRYQDGTVQLRDLRSKVSQSMPTGSDSEKSCGPAIAFSPNGSLLAFTSKNCPSIGVWDTATGSLHKIFEGPVKMVMVLVFSPDGRQLTSGDYFGTIEFWDVNTGDWLHVWKESSHEITSLAFSPSGKELASGDKGKRGILRIWDTSSGRLMFTLGNSSAAWVRALAFSHGGNQLASSIGREVIIWDPSTGSRLKVFDTERYILELSYSADGTCIETDSGEIELEDMAAAGTALSPMPRNRWRRVDEWLAHGGRRMLWLPPDVRPPYFSLAARHEGFFALGNSTGKITSVNVDPSYSPAEGEVL